MVSCNSAQSAAERSYPTSKVRGRSWDDPMHEGRWPRGVIPRLRSEAAAESARLRQHRSNWEELPHVQGQGRRLAGATPSPRSGAVTKRSYPCPRSGAAAQSARLWRCRNAWEELPHALGQGRRPKQATPRSRSCGCTGAGGSRGTIPRSRSGGSAVRRYPSSKIRSSGCALLEQLWRDTPPPR